MRRPIGNDRFADGKRNVFIEVDIKIDVGINSMSLRRRDPPSATAETCATPTGLATVESGLQRFFVLT